MAGDLVAFGGLLGSAPVMHVSMQVTKYNQRPPPGAVSVRSGTITNARIPLANQNGANAVEPAQVGELGRVRETM